MLSAGSKAPNDGGAAAVQNPLAQEPGALVSAQGWGAAASAGTPAAEAELDAVRQQLAQQDEQMAQKDEQLAQKDEENAALQTQKDEQLAQKDEQLAQQDEKMAQQAKELAQKDEENAALKKLLDGATAPVPEAAAAPVAAGTGIAVQEQLAQQAEEIAALRKRCDGGASMPVAEALPADAEHHAVDLTKLPPALRAFEVLGEAEGVAAVLAGADARALERAVQANPADAAAAAALRAHGAALGEAYGAAIGARLAGEGLFRACFAAIQAGNDAFNDVYGAVWHVVCLSEAGAFAEYKRAVAQARAAIAPGAPQVQPTADLAQLYADAGATKPEYDRLLQRVVRECAAACPGLALALPTTLKKSSRVAEKAALRRTKKGDVSIVKDVVRAMVTVKRFAHVTVVLHAIMAVAVIIRIKERFFESPSGGGWRDLMINVWIDGHICEIQIVHEMLLTARKTLPGHDVYNRVRNAMELLACRMGAAAAGDALALAWLHAATGGGRALGVEGGGVASEYSVASEWKGFYGDDPAKVAEKCCGGDMAQAVRAGLVKHRPHQSAREVFLGDKGWLSDAPLGEWVGVSVSADGRVVGLELREMGLQNALPRELGALTALESVDLRSNDKLATELRPGLQTLGLLDLTGQMHFTDAARTQLFLEHVALPEEEREAVLAQAHFLAKHGPDGGALKALHDANDLGRLPNGRWFDKEADVGKWAGVTADEAGRVVGLDLGVAKEWITVLPEEVLGGCEKLATLGLEGCGKLMVLPDLSSRPELKVEGLPEHLSEWEKGGRKRYDFMRDGFPSDPTELSFFDCGYLTALPERLGECQHLKKLNLHSCSGLTSLPERLGECQQLQELKLWRCSGLTSLPDLSSLPNLEVNKQHVEGASEAAQEWEKGGYKRYPPPPSQ